MVFVSFLENFSELLCGEVDTDVFEELFEFGMSDDSDVIFVNFAPISVDFFFDDLLVLFWFFHDFDGAQLISQQIRLNVDEFLLFGDYFSLQYFMLS